MGRSPTTFYRPKYHRWAATESALYLHRKSNLDKDYKTQKSRLHLLRTRICQGQNEKNGETTPRWPNPTPWGLPDTLDHTLASVQPSIKHDVPKVYSTMDKFATSTVKKACESSADMLRDFDHFNWLLSENDCRIENLHNRDCFRSQLQHSKCMGSSIYKDTTNLPSVPKVAWHAWSRERPTITHKTMTA